MAIELAELLALPYDERVRLAEALIESTVPPDIGPLVRELVRGLEQTNRQLEATLERLSTFDERIERVRIAAREEAMQSGHRWPFTVLP